MFSDQGEKFLLIISATMPCGSCCISHSKTTALGALGTQSLLALVAQPGPPCLPGSPAPPRLPCADVSRRVAPRALSPDAGERLPGCGDVRIQVFLFQECRTRQGLRVGRRGSLPRGTEFPRARKPREGSDRVGARPPGGPSPHTSPPPSHPEPSARPL